MSIKRIVPDIASAKLEDSRCFYGDFLGLDLVMDQGWVMTFASPVNPSAQVTLMDQNTSDGVMPDMSIEVQDVRESYAQARRRGLQVIYPLTVEPWGVIRFFVKDPNGKIVNVMGHVDGDESESGKADCSDA